MKIKGNFEQISVTLLCPAVTQSDVRFVRTHKGGRNIRYVFPVDKDHRYFLLILKHLLHRTVHATACPSERISFAPFNNV